MIKRVQSSILINILIFIPPAHSQSPQPNTDAVTVNAQVLSKKTGHFVGGLKKEDFLLYEDDVKQAVTQFSEEEQPLSVILLLDLSGSMRHHPKLIKDAALHVLQTLKAEDEIALMSFSEHTRTVQDFTKGKAAVKEKLQDLNSKDVHGATFIDEAMYQAALRLRNKAARGKGIIIITDNDILPVGGQPHSRKDAVKELHAAGAVVHGLIVPPTGPRSIDVVGVPHMNAIGNYADDTGGGLLRLEDKDARSKINIMIDNLRRHYVISYGPSNAVRSGKSRKIKLKLSPDAGREKGELMIVTRVVPTKG